ncbi:MAG TPA: NYN domain-containing protein [Ktedonobacteraceae bacterium]|jgi:uncharacterized LabA/DUF88 family protein|nr:NYN domain-containing protein [Ktedonobacteraceae bacterium]
MLQGRCLILIDGSNFYFKLKDLKLHHLLHFDFSRFITLLSGERTIIRSTYYVGAVRTDGTEYTQQLFNNQRKLLAHLQKHHLSYSLGYLMKNGGVVHEKGVDVHMAVDMLVAAYEDHCDHIILVSSDTDLIPAIKKAQELGKIVEYVGFSHKPSLGLVKNCQESTLLKREQIVSLMNL